MAENCTVNQQGNERGLAGTSPPEPQALRMPRDLALGTPAGLPCLPGLRILHPFLTGAPGAFGPQVCLKTHFF